ncbi:MAG: hypothetical protein KAW67_02985, partial [Candidatus Eisenbacteria sp.]|nr:hypothetical protein [Candidatus Eisenbacteria bacterium]
MPRLKPLLPVVLFLFCAVSAAEQRASAPAEVVRAPGNCVAYPANDDASVGDLGLQDVASASETPGSLEENGGADEHIVATSSSAPATFPSDFCLGSAGVLAVFIGMVAVGTERRQKWALRFSTNL